MLTGIELDDKKDFYTWATELLPWLNDTMRDVNNGIGDSIEEVKERQTRYTSYAARLVEVYTKAQAYYQTALAEAMEDAAKKVAPSLVARIAEGKVKNEFKVKEAVKRLNKTLETQLMSAASRLRFERSTTFGSHEGYNDIPDGFNGGGNR